MIISVRPSTDSHLTNCVQINLKESPTGEDYSFLLKTIHKTAMVCIKLKADVSEALVSGLMETFKGRTISPHEETTSARLNLFAQAIPEDTTVFISSRTSRASAVALAQSLQPKVILRISPDLNSDTLKEMIKVLNKDVRVELAAALSETFIHTILNNLPEGNRLWITPGMDPNQLSFIATNVREGTIIQWAPGASEEEVCLIGQNLTKSGISLILPQNIEAPEIVAGVIPRHIACIFECTKTYSRSQTALVNEVAAAVAQSLPQGSLFRLPANFLETTFVKAVQNLSTGCIFEFGEKVPSKRIIATLKSPREASCQISLSLPLNADEIEQTLAVLKSGDIVKIAYQMDPNKLKELIEKMPEGVKIACTGNLSLETTIKLVETIEQFNSKVILQWTNALKNDDLETLARQIPSGCQTELSLDLSLGKAQLIASHLNPGSFLRVTSHVSFTIQRTVAQNLRTDTILLLLPPITPEAASEIAANLSSGAILRLQAGTSHETIKAIAHSVNPNAKITLDPLISFEETATLIENLIDPLSLVFTGNIPDVLSRQIHELMQTTFHDTLVLSPSRPLAEVLQAIEQSDKKNIKLLPGRRLADYRAILQAISSAQTAILPLPSSDMPLDRWILALQEIDHPISIQLPHDIKEEEAVAFSAALHPNVKLSISSQINTSILIAIAQNLPSHCSLELLSETNSTDAQAIASRLSENRHLLLPPDWPIDRFKTAAATLHENAILHLHPSLAVDEAMEAIQARKEKGIIFLPAQMPLEIRLEIATRFPESQTLEIDPTTAEQEAHDIIARLNTPCTVALSYHTPQQLGQSIAAALPPVVQLQLPMSIQGGSETVHSIVGKLAKNGQLFVPKGMDSEMRTAISALPGSCKLALDPAMTEEEVLAATGFLSHRHHLLLNSKMTLSQILRLIPTVNAQTAIHVPTTLESESSHWLVSIAQALKSRHLVLLPGIAMETLEHLADNIPPHLNTVLWKSATPAETMLLAKALRKAGTLMLEPGTNMAALQALSGIDTHGLSIMLHREMSAEEASLFIHLKGGTLWMQIDWTEDPQMIAQKLDVVKKMASFSRFGLFPDTPAEQAAYIAKALPPYTVLQPSSRANLDVLIPVARLMSPNTVLELKSTHLSFAHEIAPHLHSGVLLRLPIETTLLQFEKIAQSMARGAILELPDWNPKSKAAILSSIEKLASSAVLSLSQRAIEKIMGQCKQAAITATQTPEGDKKIEKILFEKQIISIAQSIPEGCGFKLLGDLNLDETIAESLANALRTGSYFILPSGMSPFIRSAITTKLLEGRGIQSPLITMKEQRLAAVLAQNLPQGCFIWSAPNTSYEVLERMAQNLQPNCTLKLHDALNSEALVRLNTLLNSRGCQLVANTQQPTCSSNSSSSSTPSPLTSPSKGLQEETSTSKRQRSPTYSPSFEGSSPAKRGSPTNGRLEQKESGKSQRNGSNSPPPLPMKKRLFFPLHPQPSTSSSLKDD